MLKLLVSSDNAGWNAATSIRSNTK